MPNKTTADFTDWRTRYTAPQLRQNMLNSQNDSAAVMEAIQNMPYVFDPRKFIGQTQPQIAQAVHPTGVPAGGQIPNLQGLLQMLGPQVSPLLNSLLSGRGGS
jgi:hypothetical protein